MLKPLRRHEYLSVERDMDVKQGPRDLGGVSVAAADLNEALEYFQAALTRKQSGTTRLVRLGFCNAHVVNIAARDEIFRQALENMTMLPDGVGINIASRLLYGSSFPANLNGTDFIPQLIIESKYPLRIALLGAKEGVALRAAAALRQLDPRHEIVVLNHGYFDAGREMQILENLKNEPADLLLVAFGNPRQEVWITNNIGPEHAKIAAGVGALFDFWANDVRRAPEIIRRLQLEWVYRLWQEPGRLWQRYILGNPAFLLRIIRQRLRQT